MISFRIDIAHNALLFFDEHNSPIVSHVVDVFSSLSSYPICFVAQKMRRIYNYTTPLKYVSEPRFGAIAKSLLCWSGSKWCVSLGKNVCSYIWIWDKTCLFKSISTTLHAEFMALIFRFGWNVECMTLWLGIYAVLLITIENVIVIRRPNKQICI